MAESKIIGRSEEIEILNQALQSNKAEFVAIYGRRRVGKTFLIREYFSNKGIYLEFTGLKDASLKHQLAQFTKSFSKVFFKGIELKTSNNWADAFELLTKKIESISKNKKIIVFLDELPWMASKKSSLVQTLDYFWNRHWSSQTNLILVACGSAASWMLDNLIFATGGLYNRVTKRILLKPFNLRDTQKYLVSHSIKISKKLILDLYMVMGGIPFYLNEVVKGKSTVQNINDICFKEKGLLNSEFKNLFRSLFEHSEHHLQIVRVIVESNNAISREKLIKATGIPSGGAINRRLDELEAANFIQSFVPYGKKIREKFFRVIDEYTLFYLKWIEPLIEKGTFFAQGNYWEKISKTSAKQAWAGLAFESICFKHIDQIANKLGLMNIAYIAGSWRFIPPKNSKEKGTQIDLLFDRDDDVITLCEIKYSDKQFVIDKPYSKILDQKMDVFESHFPNKRKPTSKQIYLAMITTYGVKKNMYSDDLVHNEIVLDDLFTY